MMARDAVPESLDLAVIGHGEAIRPLADELARSATDRTWALFARPGVGAPSHLIDRPVSTAFSFGASTALSLGDELCTARRVIVAVPEPDAIPGEESLRGSGISYCAACDGALARGRRAVAVIDDPGLRGELDHLGDCASLDVIGDGLEAVAAAGAARVHRSRVARIEGGARLSAVVLDDGTSLAADALFFVTRRTPVDVLVPGIGLDPRGLALVDAETGLTTLDGIYALGAGTVSTGPLPEQRTGSLEQRARQVVRAALDSLARETATPAG